MSKHSGFSSGGERSAMANVNEEFEEAEVWEALHHDDDHQHPQPRSSNFMKKKFKSSSNSFASSSSAMTAQYHHGGQTQSSGHLLTAPDRSHSSAGLPLNSKGHQEQQDDEEDEMMPPHEWIAKRLARSQISSSSVCEGAGRTLKGRDLSRVRNAVLTKTGFIEQ
ncbi:unnamed protein product [Rhodiola kirilowii]